MANTKALRDAQRKRAARRPAAEAQQALRLADAAEQRAAQFEAMGQQEGATTLRAYARLGRKVAPLLRLKTPQMDRRLLTDLAVCMSVAESLRECGKPRYAGVADRLNMTAHFADANEESVKQNARRLAGVVSFFAGAGPKPGREAQSLKRFLERVTRSLPEAHPARIEMRRRLVAAMQSPAGGLRSLRRADFITAAAARR